ncbi:hypothetical protein J6590_088547 [Homalodisca vitripennis]|nr:hypothetical protein J6590_088547 [Homalodisca vitripennis]
MPVVVTIDPAFEKRTVNSHQSDDDGQKDGQAGLESGKCKAAGSRVELRRIIARRVRERDSSLPFLRRRDILRIVLINNTKRAIKFACRTIKWVLTYWDSDNRWWGKYPSAAPLFDQLTNPARSVSFTAATRSVEPVSTELLSLSARACFTGHRVQQNERLNGMTKYKKVLVPLPTPTPRRRGAPPARYCSEIFFCAGFFNSDDHKSPPLQNKDNLYERLRELGFNLGVISRDKSALMVRCIFDRYSSDLRSRRKELLYGPSAPPRALAISRSFCRAPSVEASVGPSASPLPLAISRSFRRAFCTTPCPYPSVGASVGPSASPLPLAISRSFRRAFCTTPCP